MTRSLRSIRSRAWKSPAFCRFEPSVYALEFSRRDALIFVGACGIAVREIAPYVRDKKTDPAVLVLDERARHVIPLLSGHIGGANRLAARLADALGAEPVITTATDVNGKFAVDEFAARTGCAISDMQLAKAFAAGILERDLPLASAFPIDPAPSRRRIRSRFRRTWGLHRLRRARALSEDAAPHSKEAPRRPRLPQRRLRIGNYIRHPARFCGEPAGPSRHLGRFLDKDT